MATPSSGTTLIFRNRLTALQTAVAGLQRGESVEWEGTAYGPSALPTLYVQLERLGVKAAIEAIESGQQSYTFGGMSYTRAELRVLYERDARFEMKADRAARGGIGIRYGVPHR
jgi:hypothetical protein